MAVLGPLKDTDVLFAHFGIFVAFADGESLQAGLEARQRTFTAQLILVTQSFKIAQFRVVVVSLLDSLLFFKARDVR